MAGSRDEILANFQACTGIDDVGDAFKYLEDSNWDLLTAVNQAMIRNTQQQPSEISPDVEIIEEFERIPQPYSLASEAICDSKTNTKMEVTENSEPGTSKPKNCAKERILTFHINHRNNEHKIEISEFSLLVDLKQLIWEQTNVPLCQQRLFGWKKEPKSDYRSLQSLDLPKENRLYMSPVSEDIDLTNDIMNASNRMTETYTLNIKDDINKKTYNLKFPGTSTILDVKSGFYALTTVPVRNQQWKGWPSSVKNDNVMLAQSGISYPEHDLSVSELPMKEEKKDVIDLVESDSTVDEDDIEEDDIDDEIFVDNVRSTKTQRFMPDDVTDEITGTMHFAEGFEKRYGPVHPEFFTGTFEDAVKESCLKPAKERKLLAVYLHHDNSVLANVFCTQLLNCELVLQVLSANFIVWGWDITFESNRQRFLSSVKQTLGSSAMLAIHDINFDTLPALVIIMRTRSNTEMFTVIHANVGVNELLTNLIHAVEVFQEQRRNDITVEEERQARERVKQEQDRAYQESLAADRAKEEAKQMMEELEKQRKEQAENERLAEEARKEAHRQAVESSLPPEPQQGTSDGVLKVRVRLPAGKFLERRFQSDTPLQTLLNFLIVEGYPTEEYKVLCSWPRRDLTSMDSKLTLTDLKFCPQETVILEER
ncbi:FAS-associated factor 1 isoform X1 [Ceratina calcarata]|uniref:FAS-associated factor 1 isoform X1 n=1 Tax=Ceratina calcarata TaxID=156304 RepID=A0AAJ7J0G8_9HYME|nr:FAS-associated factor 1 isoform X1 [Ceratina calcarata]